ncbi:MAG TPA: GxxExxY protein [Anaerolineae bacterium]|nr:GxxExxY protein [Anaerolineae bacterium]
MAKIIYPELSYNVQGALYDVYNALRYLELSEKGWENALMIALAEREIPARQQAEYELRYKGYRLPQGDTTQLSDHLLYPELTGELRDALYEVHGELGPGFMHMHYRRAMQIELRRRGIPYQVKKEITLRFRGQPIETRETRLLIVDSKVLLAPIAVRQITPRLKGRFRQYLGLLDLKLGIVGNFHAPSLGIETVRI